MDRTNNILNGIKDHLAQSAERFGGKKRSELKDSDFLFPETKSFPIVTPADIPDAISNFGRMKGKMDYKTFLRKLYNMAKRKGPAFIAALPEASKKELGLTEKSKSYEQRVMFPEIEYEDDRLSLLSQNEEPEEDDNEEEMEEEEDENESEEYKQEFYQMSLGSIKSIMVHANNILNALDNPGVKENLTESWLQGKIAVTEDYMITIHNFVMFGKSETDSEGSEASSKPGLWENIRKKKEKEGKNYRPAKPGDKDRPDSDQWKKLTK